jgi:hypothetical protein
MAPRERRATARTSAAPLFMRQRGHDLAPFSHCSSTSRAEAFDYRAVGADNDRCAGKPCSRAKRSLASSGEVSQAASVIGAPA